MWRAFTDVTARQLGPTVAGGALLVALYALSDFGAVSLLRFDAFTRVIHTSYQASFDRTPAAVLGLLLVALTVLITVGESRLRTRGVARLGSGLARAAEPVRLSRARVPAVTAVVAVLGAALVFPVASLGYWAATGLSGGVAWSRLLTVSGNTVVLAGWGALVATLAALPVGLLGARFRSRWTDLIEQATWAAHALPGLVIGLALVFFGIRVVPWAYQREPLLVLAYVIVVLRKKKTGMRYTNTTILSRVVPRQSQWRRHLAVALSLAALVALGLAWARPNGVEQVPRERATVVPVSYTHLTLPTKRIV